MNKKQQRLLYAFLLNTIFVLVEAVAAYYTNSLTILADLFHMVTDSVSIGAAMVAAYLGTKAADKARTYGYDRVEVLGGLFNSGLLLMTVGYIAVDSIMRIRGGSHTAEPLILIGIGILGVVINISAAYMIKDHRVDLSVDGAFIHLLADTFSSFAAILTGLLIYFTNLAVFDTVIALFIAGIIVYSTLQILRESVNIILQGSAASATPEEIRDSLTALNGIKDAHHIHIWSLNKKEHICSVHIVPNGTKSNSEILMAAQNKINSEFNIGHSTIQIENEEFIDSDAHRRSHD